MPKQKELFGEPITRPRVEHTGSYRRENVVSTRVEHQCAKCRQTIPPGSKAVKFIPLEDGKPKTDQTEYFHPQEEQSCC